MGAGADDLGGGVELAAEHLEAHGYVTDLAAPSLAEPDARAALAEAVAERLDRGLPRPTSAHVPGHGVVWALFDLRPRGREETALIRLAVEEGAMAPVWTRTGA